MWQLEIHTIDVGQGESSLVIAYNDDPKYKGRRTRTMLIDGGLAGCAQIIHQYIFQQLITLAAKFKVPVPLDHILVTHYDKDHSGGITALLVADNAFQAQKTNPSLKVPFETKGFYASTQVIDNGNADYIPFDYKIAVEGSFTYQGNNRIDSGCKRPTFSVNQNNLGNEILWNSGSNPSVAPANAPAIFLVSCGKYVWNGPSQPKGPIGEQKDITNADSIGLIVRFNNFFYYTGGDLPSAGEDLIAKAVMTKGLPDPSDSSGATTFLTPACIACFKCGHHGSDNSTSDYFLTTAKPCGAIISCGINTFGDKADKHPTQNVINRLNRSTICYFYLTNCRYATDGIPGSQGLNQLSAAGNKSRMAGDNCRNKQGQPILELASGRHRGNIVLRINQAESCGPSSGISPAPAQQYHVSYYDNDDKTPGNTKGPRVGIRTETIVFPAPVSLPAPPRGRSVQPFTSTVRAAPPTRKRGRSGE